MANQELACVYAALAIHDDGAEVTADNLKAMLTAANIKVDAFWPGLYASLLTKKSMSNLINSFGAAPAAGAAPVAAAAAAAPAAAAKEDKPAKKEEKSESEGDMGFGLFD
eukprot:TRINITY_DN2384_c0_g1::TRINITY_DN2384_c0_g1_i1::g.20683::m.20683 TRINITY_DN2384_c0_g1::TRINITY_DN2384_c0_g1_i1::g.20683  ORF type:complete len:127 (+),score=55.49,sp/P52855/RLA1_MAIZE/48.62/5e-18,Ribosomal_60s/PF00428.14/4.9e-22,PepSY_2/PF13670.1/80,PepSY_2/PF13670.1/10 TRINITY_DN2384_c0_g1_i1:54-383(+)